MLLAFDMPVPQSTVGRRNVSNVPAQALILLNDPFVLEQAARWARQFESLSTGDRIKAMYRTAFARSPSEASERPK